MEWVSGEMRRGQRRADRSRRIESATADTKRLCWSLVGRLSDASIKDPSVVSAVQHWADSLQQGVTSSQLPSGAAIRNAPPWPAWGSQALTRPPVLSPEELREGRVLQQAV